MSDSFFEIVAKLDSIIAAGPASCDYERDLAERLSNERLNEYFFGRLSDPAWFEVLHKAGKFDSVPSLQANEVEKTVGFPFWPQGEYLKKIAPHLPERVCQIIAQLPSTENARVHDCILEIALAISPGRGDALVRKVIEGIRSQYHFTLPLKIGSFINLLARAGQSSSALRLAEAAQFKLKSIRRVGDEVFLVYVKASRRVTPRASR